MWILVKHSGYTHIPEDQNCEICQKTNITKAQFRRRIDRAVPRAENFGDLITADHKVLREGCDSRTTIDVQSWCRTWPHNGSRQIRAKPKLHRNLEPDWNPKIIYTDNSLEFLEFGKSCEDLSWNHCMSTPHRSETNVIAERAVRRVKEGTSAVLLQSGLNENWWADSMESFTPLRNVTDLVSDLKTPYERRLGKPFKGTIIPFG